MDDFYAINAAKTEFREGFNLGDVARILAIADPDLVSFSDGQPSEFGKSGLEALEVRLKSLFERFTASLAAIVNEIRINGDIAYDYGVHDLTFTPKDGGSADSSQEPLCGYLAAK
jgi:ketosteroid isomerase-like protein